MMSKRIRFVIAVLLVFLAALPAFALEPTGELKGSIGVEWDEDTQKIVHTSTRTGFRFALEDELDFGGKLHFSTKGWWDWKQKDGRLALDQLWFSAYQGDLDFQVGRQAISWGTADGFNPTNYFARMSMDSLVSGDMSGDPLWAGQATYYGSNWSVTGVVVPFFTPQTLDDAMKKAMMDLDPAAALIVKAIEDTKKPRGLGKNSEWAIRAETQLAGFDIQASFFSGYEPLPGLEMVLKPSLLGLDLGPLPPVETSFEGTYRRQHFAGLAVTGTIGPVGVWGEVTYGGPKPFAESENPLELARVPFSINEKYLQAVVGGDYTFAVGNGLLAQGQYIYRGQGSLLEPYVMPNVDLATLTVEPGEIEGAHYLYGRLAYDFIPGSSVEVLVLHGFSEKGGIIRPAYTHRFPNSVQLQLSLIRSYGKDDLLSMGTQGQLAVTYRF